MLLRSVLVFCLLWDLIFVLAENHNVLDVDFMQSMTDGNSIARDIVRLNFKNIKVFKDHYDAKKPSRMPYRQEPFIPKIMHQVWLGDEKIPPLYEHYMNECKILHPDWEFKVWYDKDIEKLGLDYKDIYDKARSYTGRSDIARYEILYKFGGVYRDMDVKCFRPIDDLNHKYDFFTFVDPPLWHNRHHYLGHLGINNGVIGAAPNHLILKKTLTITHKNFDKHIEGFDRSINDNTHSFIIKSSMIPLTDAFLEKALLDDRSIVLPSTYGFSLINLVLSSPNHWVNKLNKITKKSPPPAFHFLRNESLMLHNIKKYEVNYCDFNKGNHMGSTKIQRLLKALKPGQARIMKNLREAYTHKAPRAVSWRHENRTPQIVHFIVFDNLELSKLEKKLHIWKTLNSDFEIKVWNKMNIIENFKDLSELHKLKLTDDLRFYIALRILEKFGGSYANFKSTPHQPLFEFCNKYSFYGGLMPLTRVSSKISLSQKLLGSKKNHPIISNTLSKIDPYSSASLSRINEIFLLEAYKNIYLFGQNVVLPAVYFEPFAKIKHEPIIDKITRLITKRPKAFSNLTEFTLIE